MAVCTAYTHQSPHIVFDVMPRWPVGSGLALYRQPLGIVLLAMLMSFLPSPFVLPCIGFHMKPYARQ